MDNSRYADFVTRRRRLNERLDSLGRDVDEWIEGYNGTPSMSVLATLEGLLTERRLLLTRLAELDESFVQYLVTLRNELQPLAD